MSDSFDCCLTNPTLLEKLPDQLGLYSIKSSEPILAGQWLENQDHKLPIFRYQNQQAQFIAAAETDLKGNLSYNLEGNFQLAGKPLLLPDNEDKLLLLADHQGVTMMLFVIDQLQKRMGLNKLRQRISMILFGAAKFPFQPVPSRFMVSSSFPSMPIDSIASTQLLEDLSLPARLASDVGAAGCFDGSLCEMLEQIYQQPSSLIANETSRKTSLEENISVIAIGSDALLKSIKKLLVVPTNKQFFIHFE